MVEFSREFDGISTYQMTFHNPDLRNHQLYNNWNFTSNYFWDSLTNDSFWYSPKTSLLYSTNVFEIGREVPEQIDIDIQPIKFIHVD